MIGSQVPFFQMSLGGLGLDAAANCMLGNFPVKP
jgi:hypothetical protein